MRGIDHALDAILDGHLDYKQHVQVWRILNFDLFGIKFAFLNSLNLLITLVTWLKLCSI